MKILSVAIILFWVLGSAPVNAQEQIAKDLTCKESYELIQQHKNDTNFVIVDLRPERLYRMEHIENAIFSDVYSEKFESWANNLNKNKVYLLYCTVGQRSRAGFNKMKDLGFKFLYHLHQGIRTWIKEGYETSKTIEIASIEKTLNNVFGWAVNKDFNLFYGSIANDTNFISVTPNKRVKFGFNAVRKDSSFWANPDFKAVRHELKNLRINLSASGDVAWFFCILDDINTIKGEPANWENVRWTGVLEKRNGKWRVVQQHFSWPKE